MGMGLGFGNEANSSVNLTYTGNFGSDRKGYNGFHFGNNAGVKNNVRSVANASPPAIVVESCRHH